MGQTASTLYLASRADATQVREALSTLRAQDANNAGILSSNLEYVDDEGKTSLHWASANGNEDIVKSLLEAGASVDAQDSFRNTSLITAAFLGHVGVAKLLVEEGKANVNAANQDGMTPLHYAIAECRYECIELLLKEGADITLKNKKNLTPIELVDRLKLKDKNKMEPFLIKLLHTASSDTTQTTQLNGNQAQKTNSTSSVNGSSTQATTKPAGVDAPTPAPVPTSTTTTQPAPTSATTTQQPTPTPAPQQPQTQQTQTQPQQTQTHKATHPTALAEAEKFQINRVRRLAFVCRLWGLIKYVHPCFIHTDVDLDSVLVQILPQLTKAISTSQYQQVVQTLLKHLQDPNTECVDLTKLPKLTTIPGPHHEQPSVTMSDDSTIAIIHLNHHEQFQDYAKLLPLVNTFREVASAPRTNALVFDLRLKRGSPLSVTSQVAFRYMFVEAIRSVLTKPILLPSTRSRMFVGLPQARNYGNNFHSSYVTRDPEVIYPVNPADPKFQAKKNWAFIVNRGTPESIIDVISALQIEEQCRVIQEKFEGESDIELGISTLNITIGEQLAVYIRKTEKINKDGTLGFLPDLTTTATANDTSDVALVAACDVASGKKVSNFLTRKPVTSYGRKYLDAEFADSLPTLEYRLLAFFRLWNAVNFFFPYKQLMDISWEDMLMQFIPRFEEAKSALDYNFTICQLVHHLCDSHATVTSTLLANYFGSFIPPIELKSIENKTVVSFIFDEKTASDAGLSLGDQIVSINKEDIGVRRAKLSELMSFSTKQSEDFRIHQRMLSGEKDGPLSLEIVNGSGKIHAAKLKRTHVQTSLLKPLLRTPCYVTPEGYGFIDCVNLLPHDVEQAMETIKNTSALILDVRGYPRGVIFHIAPRLISKKLAVAKTQTPVLMSDYLYSDLEPNSLEEIHVLSPSTSWKYENKPVIVLINSETVSHAEHSCLYLSSCPNVVFVGQTTAGSNGNVTNVALPGGVVVSFTGLGATYETGAQLQRKGIQPHVVVEQTISGIRNRKDEIFDAAITYLNEKLHPQPTTTPQKQTQRK